MARCSLTDPDARLARKSTGTASTLAHVGSVVMENRHGLGGVRQGQGRVSVRRHHYVFHLDRIAARLERTEAG